MTSPAVLIAARLIDRFTLLSWPLRLIWLGIFFSLITNAFASRLWNVEPRWRKLYVWKSAVCGLSVVYFLIVVLGFISQGVVVSLLRWVFPLYAFSMGISAVMHIFEWKALNEVRHAPEPEVRLVERREE